MQTIFVIYHLAFFILIFVHSLIKKTKSGIILSYLLLVWSISVAYALFMHLVMPWADTNITLLPFVFFQVCFLINIYPIKKFNETCLTYIKIANPLLLKYMLIFFALVAVVPFFENLFHVLTTYSSTSALDLYDIYENKMTEGGFQHKVAGWLSLPGKIGNSFTGKFFYLLSFLLFFYLTLEKINKYLLIGIILAVANPLLFQLAMAGRGSVAFFILEAIFLFLLFRKQIPVKRRKNILVIGSIFIGFAVLAMSIMTIVRKEGSGASFSDMEMVGFYLGRSHLTFNCERWHMKQHTQGDAAFSFFKYIFGFPTFTDTIKFREYWTDSKLGISVHLFGTYLGSWFSDLGKAGTILFSVVLAFWMRIVTKRNISISLSSLFLFYIYFDTLLVGWSTFKFGGFGLMLNVVFCYIVLVLITSLQKR